MRPILYVLSAVFFSVAHSAQAVTADDFRRQVEQYNYFSNTPATFATYCRGDDCLSTAAGYTAFSRREPATTENLVSIGSNSKLITAILTLKLVDQGYLRLDDKLTDYFPEYALWSGVTVRHLLQHASGVPPYLFSQDGFRRTVLSVFNWRTRIWAPSDLVRIVAKQPLMFAPGSRIEYNNTNYVLIGMILEKATGKPLATLLQDELFGPLGMKDTFLSLPANEARRRVAGYVSLQIPLPDWIFNLLAQKVEKIGEYLETTRIFHDSLTWAAGGMVSTTEDIAILLRALFRGRIIRPGLLDEMMTFQSGTALGMPILYGLGLMKMPTRQGDLLGHGGLTPGYQIISNYSPSQDVTLNIAQNLGPSQLYSVYFDLFDVLTQDIPIQDFVPKDHVGVEHLPDQAIHVRVYGRIKSDASERSFFPQSFGYSKLRVRRYQSVYQTYETRREQRGERALLTVEAKGGGSLFGGSDPKQSKRPFFILTIDTRALSDRNGDLAVDTNDSSALFAYRGVESQNADGSTARCIFEVIDRTRPLPFQLEGQKGESFEPEQTLKFVGNIPLRRLSAQDMPPELAGQSVDMCR